MYNRIISKLTDTLFIRHLEFVLSEKQEKGLHFSTHSRLSTFTKQPPTIQNIKQLYITLWSECCGYSVKKQRVVAMNSNLRCVTGYTNIFIIFLNVFSSISEYGTKIRLCRLIQIPCMLYGEQSYGIQIPGYYVWYIYTEFSGLPQIIETRQTYKSGTLVVSNYHRASQSSVLVCLLYLLSGLSFNASTTVSRMYCTPALWMLVLALKKKERKI
jgi:hypothetical protein